MRNGVAKSGTVIAAWFRGSRTLGEVISDRTNNLDLIRLVAALAVLWGHTSFFAPDIYGELDPVMWISGGREYPGSVAVQAFFLISGILISASMERHRSVEKFLIARFARLWPGYMVCIAAMVYMLVPLTSHTSLFERAHLRNARLCLRTNAFFPINGACGSLTNAFANSPVKDSFGFPYWTLVTETHCYALVLVLGIALSRVVHPVGRMFGCLGGTCAFLVGFLWLTANPPGPDSIFQQDVTLQGGYSVLPVLFFLSGMGLHAVRRWLKVSQPLALGLTVAAFLPFAPITLGYVAFAYGILAVASARSLRWLRPRHDLSFGVYIYGAAMQQVTVAITGPAPPWVNFVGAAPLAVACAYISWHLIEAPSIQAGHALLTRSNMLRPHHILGRVLRYVG